jgi:hypothetical protein
MASSSYHAAVSMPSGANPASFGFVKTSTTGGTLYHGSVYLAGVAKTMSAWTNHGTGADLTISGVTSTTRYYVAVELGSGTATWNSTTGAFPASDDDTEVFPILTLTCADSVITAIKEHHACDIHVPSNV